MRVGVCTYTSSTRVVQHPVLQPQKQLPTWLLASLLNAIKNICHHFPFNFMA